MMMNPLDLYKPSLLRCNIMVIYLRLRLAFTLSISMRFYLGYNFEQWKYYRERARERRINRKDGDYGQ